VSLARHRQDWEQLAEADALWAVLTSGEGKGRRWDLEDFFATGEAEVAAVEARLAGLGRPARRERALDFGCGVGRLTRALAGRFGSATGVDIAAGMVEQARRLNGDVPNAEFVLNDAPDLAQFADGTFDFVYSSIVLQHLPSQREIAGYVTEFLRVARPDGLVVFGLPTAIAFPWSLQPRRRLYGLLRRLGVHEQWVLAHTPLTPMRMTPLREERVRALLAESGATVLAADAIDDGPVRARRYYVSPR
jgi:SAM-dependent methyltransferase